MTGSPRSLLPHAHLAGTRALVMGLGSFGGGVGAARYLALCGARVLVTDKKPAQDLAASVARLHGLEIELVLGEHRRADFERADLVVASPAVKPDDPLLAAARASGARISSEIELFLEAVRGRVACVTGTQGKSSTANLLHAFLSGSGFRCHLGGNIGGSLLEALPSIESDHVVVLELSSYQLESLAAPRTLTERVEAVAVTNILLDHLERHGSVEAYVSAKARILDLVRPGGVAVVPAEETRLSVDGARGVRRIPFWQAGRGGAGLVLDGDLFSHDGEVLGRTADLALPGDFQRENALVALGLARALGAGASALTKAVSSARGLEHRLQDLGVRRGRRVHDNGVSTTPDSTIAALRSLPRGMTLILGGRMKLLPLQELADVAAERAHAAVTYGEAGAELAALLAGRGLSVGTAATLEEAVECAFERTPLGGDVLFSPACSSFDAFANFEARARAFREALPPLDRDVARSL